MEQELSKVVSVLVDIKEVLSSIDLSLQDIVDAQRGTALKNQAFPPSHRK